MILKKNEENFEPKEDVIIEVSQKLDEVNYSLKIYISKDKQSIIFKVEQENIQTHYYYEKFYLEDFKRNYKIFNMMNSLLDIFQNLKTIIGNYSTKIENTPSNKLKITISKSSEIFAIFSLRKKIRSQNRLNLVLMEQIQENKNKIKSIKKQSTKLEKTTKSQDEIINEINTKIDNINENLDKIIEEINDLKEEQKNNQSSIQKGNENKKQNKTNKKLKGEEMNKNKSKDTSNKKEEGKEDDVNMSLPKKRRQIFYDMLLILNIFIIILVAYLFKKIHTLERNEQLEKLKFKQMRKKYTFIRLMESMKEEELLFVQKIFESGEVLEDEIEQDKKKLKPKRKESEKEKEDENIKKDDDYNINELNEDKNRNIDNNGSKDEIKNNNKLKE